jgi:hypothetical protein
MLRVGFLPDVASGALLMSLFSSMTVLAYFDPGAGSLLLQALVGGAAGLMVFGRYLMERYLPGFLRRR